MCLVRPAVEPRGGVGPSLLSRLAAVVGTPLWVYDAGHIRARLTELTAALQSVPHRIHYAVKANSSLGVLRVLREAGARADIVSEGELRRALAAGFAPDDVIFSGVGKSAEELEAALRAGVGIINVESRAELDLLHCVAERVGLRARIGLRVNPDVQADTHPYTRTGEKGMKFGVPWDEVPALAALARAHGTLELVSLGMHLGSQIGDPAPYREGAGRLRQLIDTVRAAGTDTLRHVDVGGGLAIAYGQGAELGAEAFAAAVTPLARASNLALIVEPGRWLVGNAGVLLTRVLYRKHAGGQELAIVDAGMNDLLRPSLYRAEHPIWVVTDGDEAEGAEETFDIVGPICETGDFLGHGRRLRGVAAGTLLAVGGAGAYGFSMSSNYNSRPRAAEVLVDGSRWGVIRSRETWDDLTRGETAEPDWQ